MLASLDAFLAERSGLTAAQIETASLQLLVNNAELDARTAAKRRTPAPVSVGAYHRVLQQTRENVREAIYTLLFAQRKGYLRTADLRRLLDLVSSTSNALDAADVEQVASLVEALVRRIVML